MPNGHQQALINHRSERERIYLHNPVQSIARPLLDFSRRIMQRHARSKRRAPRSPLLRQEKTFTPMYELC